MLFTKFFQESQGLNKATEGGVGLGLSISKEIIKAHNGTIKVESEVGKGTAFKIRFPVKIKPFEEQHL
jgi:signal transduction histidine kinase